MRATKQCSVIAEQSYEVRFAAQFVGEIETGVHLYTYLLNMSNDYFILSRESILEMFNEFSFAFSHFLLSVKLVAVADTSAGSRRPLCRSSSL